MQANGITSDLARDQFLELLVTQLRNQDPLEPVKQHDFLSQLAQFSTLEGIENLNDNIEARGRIEALSQGSDLLGRVVAYQGSERPVETGMVESVQLEGDKLVLNVNGSYVPIELVDTVVQ